MTFPGTSDTTKPSTGCPLSGASGLNLAGRTLELLLGAPPARRIAASTSGPSSWAFFALPL